MSSFHCENHRGSLTLTLLNVLGVLNVLNVLKLLNVLNVLNVLNMPMDASLACWALFQVVKRHPISEHPAHSSQNKTFCFHCECPQEALFY